jgi:hypothetical protein
MKNLFILLLIAIGLYSNTGYAECWFKHNDCRTANVTVVYAHTPVQYVVQYQPIVVSQPVYIPVVTQQVIEYKPVTSYYIPNQYYYGNSYPSHFYYNPWNYYRY